MTSWPFNSRLKCKYWRHKVLLGSKWLIQQKRWTIAVNWLLPCCHSSTLSPSYLLFAPTFPAADRTFLPFTSIIHVLSRTHLIYQSSLSLITLRSTHTFFWSVWICCSRNILIAALIAEDIGCKINVLGVKKRRWLVIKGMHRLQRLLSGPW